ncbi:N-6 DNA methylase [Sphingobium sp. AS12]|uniref:N-6 DNA methylase n=1 Tax=Sphingobium sp. AS12 TaxID=2849495 RepID=UPI001C313FB4|nr:N-6 DNA methylase [Sphingobium sp. AS12]MBV2149905.1 N-6 DNA methylase [Sphingobium sp. AS12]
MTPHQRHIKAASKLLRSSAYHHNLHALFRDCMEAAAISVSNSVDIRNRELRERRYLEIVGAYERKIVDVFPQVFAEIVMALEQEPSDALGAIYMDLELGSTDKGQFFTPYPVCRMMAEVTLSDADAIRERIERKGFVSAMEPACGAGAMVIALAEAMRARDINYQRHLHVTAVDIDRHVAQMAYIQFALLHIPAVVFVGDSLSLEMREAWHTPAHILGGWSARLACRDAEAAAKALAEMPPEPAVITRVSAPPSGRSQRPQQLSLF